MLKDLIENKKAKVAIIGLGYVGLPHAVEIAKSGMQVFGIDIKKERVEKLNKEESYIQDVKDSDIRDIIQIGKFAAFDNFEILKDCDVVIICVPTPLDKYKIPDISYIKSSAEQIKKYIRRGQLIILESTTYPGTTEEVLLPIFESSGLKVGSDFNLAFAPERIDPGNKLPFSDVPKVVGGITKECTDMAVLFYQQFLKSVHPVSSAKAAEMTKILENTYRLVNISMVNELALLCGKMGIDIWEVIEAAKTKPYGFTPFYPSPKIGGHCIPLDPFYLSWKAKEYNFWARFIELAGEINEQMPHIVVTKINSALNQHKKSIKGSKILIMGAAYKKDINDARESAFYDIFLELKKKGAIVDYYDLFIDEIAVAGEQIASLRFTEKPVKEYLKEYDLVLILTDHTLAEGYTYDDLARDSNLVVDTRNAIKSREHKNVYYL